MQAHPAARRCKWGRSRSSSRPSATSDWETVGRTPSSARDPLVALLRSLSTIAAGAGFACGGDGRVSDGVSAGAVSLSAEAADRGEKLGWGHRLDQDAGDQTLLGLAVEIVGPAGENDDRGAASQFADAADERRPFLGVGLAERVG